ncbi:hypothetical protein [Azospirillum sp.]|uniref:hypothetical protein n=1 Tax=Azospirillum sp. TaxID=34012 RepID=UPI002D57C1FB|nr:hypothetical protein [Azospirillum sp.]HYD70595.1 hypothetical protein [Azospirillum sp.]
MSLRNLLISLSLSSLCLAEPALSQEIEHYILEAYPEAIQARFEQQARELLALPRDVVTVRPEMVMDALRKWGLGNTITFAFKGGDADLHKKIAAVSMEWTKYANLKFDFGYDANTGEYRKWSTSDTSYKADVRISFDQVGYWSIVGKDSVVYNISPPGEASLNLEGFDRGLPSDWEGTVLHEIGHAIGAHHEHQHPTLGCDAEWRWDDDPGYVPTRDQFGRFKADGAGRRPGIYTVLGGPPNKWSRSKVDHNLRQLTNSSAYDVGEFDVKSIMKYYFAAWMFRQGEKSQCYNGVENTVLSDEDKKRIAQIYPAQPAAAMASEKSASDPNVSKLIDAARNLPSLRHRLETYLQKP